MIRYRYFILLLLAMYTSFAPAQVQWLLSYQGKSANEFIWDKRTAGLIKSTIPNPFSGKLLDGLGGPPDPVRISENRYFSTSACKPHECFTKSFYWYDMHTGKSIGAILDDGGRLSISSKNVTVKDIPKSAIGDLRRWLSDVNKTPTQVNFAPVHGKNIRLQAKDFQPLKKFQPTANGPSFDCLKANSKIENVICKNPELSKVDLELHTLYNNIYYANSTLPDRSQLSIFQKKWLRSRDASCNNAENIDACLMENYKLQKNALMNWLPHQ